MATIRMIALVVCSLALVQLVALCQANNGDKKSICSGGIIWLRRVSNLKGLSAEGCEQPVKDAFSDLLILVQYRDICIPRTAAMITDYYKKHLANGGQAKLPEVLVRFVIAYGMQASSDCKWFMVKELYALADERVLKPSDYEALDDWIKDDGPIARLLDPIYKQAEVLLPSDLMALMPEIEDRLENKLALKVKKGDKIIRAQAICERRFRPLYEATVMAITQYDRNGINYNQLDLAAFMSTRPSVQRKNIQWSRIIFLCETLNGLEISDESGKTKYNVVTPGTVMRYQASWVCVREPIFGLWDFRIKGPVRQFDVSLSETERLKQKLLDNKWKLLVAAFKSKDTTASLVKKALEIASSRTEGKNEEEFALVKKELLSLLDSDEADTVRVVKVIAKMVSGSKNIASLISILLQVMIVAIALIPSLIIGGVCLIGEIVGCLVGIMASGRGGSSGDLLPTLTLLNLSNSY